MNEEDVSNDSSCVKDHETAQHANAHVEGWKRKREKEKIRKSKGHPGIKNAETNRHTEQKQKGRGKNNEAIRKRQNPECENERIQTNAKQKAESGNRKHADGNKKKNAYSSSSDIY